MRGMRRVVLLPPGCVRRRVVHAIQGAAVSGGDLGPAVAKSTPVAGYPEWLTGGAFGPEASLPALVVCTFAGVAALFAAWRTGRLRSPTLTANATLAIGQENRAALPSPA